MHSPLASVFLLTIYPQVATFLTHCTNHSPWLDIHPLRSTFNQLCQISLFLFHISLSVKKIMLIHHIWQCAELVLLEWINLISLSTSSLQSSTCSTLAGKGFVTLACSNQLILCRLLIEKNNTRSAWNINDIRELVTVVVSGEENLGMEGDPPFELFLYVCIICTT